MSSIPAKVKLEVYNKYGGKCAYCGEVLFSADNFTCDHIIPKSVIKKNSIGITNNSIENLNPCCANCNNLKGDKTLDEFRTFVFNRIEENNFFLNRMGGIIRLLVKLNVLTFNNSDKRFYFERE